MPAERPDGMLTVSEAERLLGLRGGGLHRWLKRHRYLKQNRCPKIGKYRYVPVRILKEYEAKTNLRGAERMAKRPRGYVGIERAAELASCSTSMIEKEVQRGNIHAARVGFVQSYHPADCARLRQSMNDKPLPGYAQVLAYTKPRRADNGAALRWLKTNGVRVRKFRRPEDHQYAWYAVTEGLELWAAQYVHGRQPRKITMDQAREIRVRRLAGEKRCVLAAEFGVHEATVWQIAQGKTYREAV